MSVIATAVRHMLASGMTHEAIVEAVAAMDSERSTGTARQERNRRHYVKLKAERLKASETEASESVLKRLKASETEASEKRLKASESVLNSDAPRARGLDKPLRLVTSGNVVGVVVAGAREEIWPLGDPAKALVAAIESPWLDPHKSPGLITTAGRVTAWRRDGASWEHDVLPVVRGLCANRRGPISTWKFFDAAIGQSIADNRRALEIPEALSRQATGPPLNYAAQLGAEQAEARRRVLED